MTAVSNQAEKTVIRPDEYVIAVSFMKVGKRYYFDYHRFPELRVGDYVIVETSTMGEQMGEVKGFTRRSEVDDRVYIHEIIRPATPADLLLRQQWKEKDVTALIDCREKAAAMGGYQNVKFVSAEYNYNGKILTYFFTADDNQRINTHRLRIALQRTYNLRVEFRQVGPRDVAKLLGGLGACGIPRCCSTFLTEFSMVSIGMAKAQDISLNPAEITGVCGRLRCCLTYEYEQYVQARRSLPRLRKRMGTKYGEGRVVEVHPMEDAVTVQVDDKQYLIPREELRPLDEYEALHKAAASPCSKSEGGGCDCGAKRPRGSADELMGEMGIEDFDIDDDYTDDTEPYDELSPGDTLPVATSPQRSDSQKNRPQGDQRQGNRRDRRPRRNRYRKQGNNRDRSR
jgi:cell fate regulator YaaT (PSP1 superfamily)